MGVAWMMDAERSMLMAVRVAQSREMYRYRIHHWNPS